MSKIIDLSGLVFGRWTVVSFAERRKHNTYWSCKCVCGKGKIVSGANLVRKTSTSCGCYKDELAKSTYTIHGLSSTPTYNSWWAMKQRCNNSTHPAYSNYGGRGIKICERWKNSVENFREDMGERPQGLSLDRIDTNGDYTPLNCKWSSRKEQQNNRRTTMFVVYKGENRSLSRWSEEVGVDYHTLRYRLAHGWSVEDSFTKGVPIK